MNQTPNEDDIYDDDTCPLCSAEVLEEHVLYTDGETVDCPDCQATLLICCSPETGLHLHEQWDED